MVDVDETVQLTVAAGVPDQVSVNVTGDPARGEAVPGASLRLAGVVAPAAVPKARQQHRSTLKWRIPATSSDIRVI